MSACFCDQWAPESIEHSLTTLIGQRILGLALGYEDVVDHDRLRHDPMLAAVFGKLTVKRARCAPLAGKATLNRLEHAPEGAATRYHKIGHDGAAIERLFVDLFLEAHTSAPEEIVLDLDATDDPLHGNQEGRFFHGYYGHYCYLPLYIFCGRHLLCAKLRPADIDASAGAETEVARIVGQIRGHWPKLRVVLRADSGFAREALMAWCEQNDVDFVFGLARNTRLVAEIAAEQAQAAEAAKASGQAERRFKDFSYRTRKSWSRARRVVGKAEHLPQGANTRFVVTSLSAAAWAAQALYEQRYCARGECRDGGSAAGPRFRDPGVEVRNAIPVPGRRFSHARGADEGREAAGQIGDGLGWRLGPARRVPPRQPRARPKPRSAERGARQVAVRSATGFPPQDAPAWLPSRFGAYGSTGSASSGARRRSGELVGSCRSIRAPESRAKGPWRSRSRRRFASRGSPRADRAGSGRRRGATGPGRCRRPRICAFVTAFISGTSTIAVSSTTSRSQSSRP